MHRKSRQNRIFKKIRKKEKNITRHIQNIDRRTFYLCVVMLLLSSGFVIYTCTGLNRENISEQMSYNPIDNEIEENKKFEFNKFIDELKDIFNFHFDTSKLIDWFKRFISWWRIGDEST